MDADGARDVSYASVVVTAAGYLNRPRWPDLAGRERSRASAFIRRGGIRRWI